MTKKPEWIRVKGVDERVLKEMKALLDRYHLHTVCESAVCPNMGSCFKAGTATFMILGNICTRNCAFCGVATGKPLDPDPEEPENVALASRDLKLKHVVVTSVTRDDLPDGGAGQFAKTIAAINRILPEATTDVLIPDLKASIDNLKIVIDARPDILAHNLETVPRLYLAMRQGASYENSLQVLANSKKLNPDVCTKSGVMLGVGEKREEVIGVMRDLSSVGCDFLTIGQYLRPAAENLEVTEFITPEAFEEYRVLGYEMGFRYVASSPFVRSSFHAEEALKAIGYCHTPAN
ncbi:MAG: lipoyl synthase [Deltaproteobacteria bacterium]|nr:lipoyl synthase [Deltaproteobacteria bacterium]